MREGVIGGRQGGREGGKAEADKNDEKDVMTEDVDIQKKEGREGYESKGGMEKDIRGDVREGGREGGIPKKQGGRKGEGL